MAVVPSSIVRPNRLQTGRAVPRLLRLFAHHTPFSRVVRAGNRAAAASLYLGVDLEDDSGQADSVSPSLPLPPTTAPRFRV